MSTSEEIIAARGPIAIVRSTGTVAELHGQDPFETPVVKSLLASGSGPGGSGPGDRGPGGRGLIVRHCVHPDSALVLGSRQPEGIVDRSALDSAHLGLVRRRSGGGAVLVVPGAMVWVEFVASRHWFPDDVRGSMVAAGRLWLRALADLGIDPLVGAEVYDGPLVGDPWADLVCFAGRGPGEILVGANKLVGLSQRRSRAGVRISGTVHRRDLVAATAELMAPPRPDGSPTGAATCGDVGLGGLDDDLLIRALAAGAENLDR